MAPRVRAGVDALVHEAEDRPAAYVPCKVRVLPAHGVEELDPRLGDRLAETDGFGHETPANAGFERTRSIVSTNAVRVSEGRRRTHHCLRGFPVRRRPGVNGRRSRTRA